MTDFEITTPGGPLVCGYCGKEEDWQRPPAGLPADLREQIVRIPAFLALGGLSLTGEWSLAVGPAGELVVVAFALTRRGEEVSLPHHCAKIPAEVRELHAGYVAALISARPR